MNDDSQIIEMIIYVKQKIDELSLNERRDILQILINNGLEDKIIEKGGGSQIKFKEIPRSIIVDIHKYAKTKIEEKLAKLINITGDI